MATPILQIESLRDKSAREEQARKVLEEEKRLQGLKATQAILKAQKESMGTYKLQIENLQKELSVIFLHLTVFSLFTNLIIPTYRRRARDNVRAVEAERDDVDRVLIHAQTSARQLKEQNVVLQAREEGRRQSFERGLSRSDGTECPTNPEPIEAEPKRSPRRNNPPPPPPNTLRSDAEAARALLEIIKRQDAVA